jgi:hypothetical protein
LADLLLRASFAFSIVILLNQTDIAGYKERPIISY